MTLAGWLRAQLDEDERIARAVDGDSCWFDCGADGHGDHHARWDVDRVLAEVTSKRRIIDLHEGDHECSTLDHNGDIDNCAWVVGGNCTTMRWLALPYADRPGYREEWRPE